mgnify:FL=1
MIPDSTMLRSLEMIDDYNHKIRNQVSKLVAGGQRGLVEQMVKTNTILDPFSIYPGTSAASLAKPFLQNPDDYQWRKNGYAYVGKLGRKSHHGQNRIDLSPEKSLYQEEEE